jgi:ketosteroid isomerase-like protein
MRLFNRLAVCAVAGIFLASACAPSQPPGPTAAEMVAAADAVDVAFLDAFNKGDVDALMATYWKSPDLVSISLDGMGVKGWDATKKSSAELFKGLPGAKLEFFAPQNVAFGETVLGSGTWKATIPAAQGAPQVMEGRYSDVKAFRDGKWVYVMDHASVPLPPPPPAPANK